MLVLSRQRDEMIIFDFSKMTVEDMLELKKTLITVTVVDIRGDKVRLGSVAPRCVDVHRQEVYDAIQREHHAMDQLPPEEIAGVEAPMPKGPAMPVSTTGLHADRRRPKRLRLAYQSESNSSGKIR